METADTWRDANPWKPMDKSIDLKHMGKLGEELNECASAINRCIIQGIDEPEPTTGKINRQWLKDEMIDVMVNIDLVCEHFGINLFDEDATKRYEKKKKYLKQWHGMLDDGTESNT